MDNVKVLPAGAEAGSEFLDLVGPDERSVRRLAVILLLSAPLALVAVLVSATLCIAAAAALSGTSFGHILELAEPGFSGERHLLSYGFELSLAGVASIAAALVLLVVASKVQRRAPLTFLTAAPRLRSGLFLWGLAVGAVLVGLALVVERLWAQEHAVPPILTPGAAVGERAGYAVMAIGFLFLAALAEEIIFRGWLIQQASAWTRNIALMLAVNGLIFSFVHFDPDVSGFLIRCLMGAGWAWIAIRTGGIEFTTGAHLANNLLVSLFVAPVSFAAKPSGGVDLAAVALEGAVILALVAVVEASLRIKPAGPAPRAVSELRLRR